MTITWAALQVSVDINLNNCDIAHQTDLNCKFITGMVTLSLHFNCCIPEGIKVRDVSSVSMATQVYHRRQDKRCDK